MTTPITVTRGTEVAVSVAFTTAAGNPVTPVAVRASVAYYPAAGGALLTEDLPMTLSGGSWAGTWDTSKARASTVFWHVESDDPAVQAIAVDGSFAVTANPANQ